MVTTIPWAAGATEPLPTPELNRFGVNVLPPVPCTADPGNTYEAAQYADEGWADGVRYPGACQRLRFVFGPILVKPGQNDVLLTLTAEKPAYDGYAIRRKPNLTDSLGNIPPVEQLHLHHGTWLYGLSRSSFASSPYGEGPFWASGEEKTIGLFPQGYGVSMRGTDPWIFLFMVHSGVSTPGAVYVIDSIDYIDKAAAEDEARWAPSGCSTPGQVVCHPFVKATKNLWLDVGRGGWHPDAQPYSFNPVFNMQRGFGHTDTGSFWQPGTGSTFTVDADTSRKVCYFPKENCARFNSANNVSAQQGYDAATTGPDFKQPLGDDVRIDEGVLGPDPDANVFDVNDQGTIIVMGGHVHPGGIRDEVSLVRGATCNEDGRDCTGGVEKPIHISDAIYWNATNPNVGGELPISWDLAMTGTGVQTGWRVLVHRGDVLRLNGVYDTTVASSYEQMGIVMSWIAPGDTSGLDVFQPGVTFDPRFPTGIPLPEPLNSAPQGKCTQDLDLAGGATLCLRGGVTHGSYEASQNHLRCTTDCPAIEDSLLKDVMDGPVVEDIAVGVFGYGVADLGTIAVTGIPRIVKGTEVEFWNVDTAAYAWHTITRCSYPCTGSTSASYPIPDGGQMIVGGDPMDFDSAELGYGLAPANKISWKFTPTQSGDFTFFCRIHPGMRGAIRVVDSA